MVRSVVIVIIRDFKTPALLHVMAAQHTTLLLDTLSSHGVERFLQDRPRLLVRLRFLTSVKLSQRARNVVLDLARIGSIPLGILVSTLSNPRVLIKSASVSSCQVI